MDLENFYLNVNEKWIAKHAKKSDIFEKKTNYSILYHKNINIILKYLKEQARKATKNIHSDLYYLNKSIACQMSLINEHFFYNKIYFILGYPLRQSKKNYNVFISKMIHLGISPFFNLSVKPYHLKSGSDITYMVHIEDPIYFIYHNIYVIPNKSYEKIRVLYKRFISDMLQTVLNINKNIANIISENIYNFESNLAIETVFKKSRSNYHVVSGYDISKSMKYIDIEYISKRLRVSSNLGYVVGNMGYLSAVDKLIWSQDEILIKWIYVWRYILKYGKYFKEKVQDVIQDFFKKTKMFPVQTKLKPKFSLYFQYAKIYRPREISKVFVERRFTADYVNAVTAAIIDIVKLCQEVLILRIKDIKWLHDTTKIEAMRKIQNMKIKVGYREKNYALELSNTNEIISVCLLKNINDLYKKGQDVSWNDHKHTEGWNIESYDVNAYYSSINNEIVFPIGLLQKPFFDLHKGMEYNFARIGTIIGHEISHSIDSSNILYDSLGQFRNWWKVTDKQIFLKKSMDVVNEYKKYSHDLNPYITLSENIADITGMRIALDAYKKKKTNSSVLLSPKDLGNIELKHYRQFFKNYARLWRETSNNHKNLIYDTHSPPMYRTNIVLKNMIEFQKTFNPTPLNTMYKKIQSINLVWE
ncbi:putative metalloendopeptidase [Namao virus]|nr:putative metalloendopeptidase [Namao virus]